MLVASWNINGIRARIERVKDWIDRNQPDILCLQEIKIETSLFPVDELQSLGYHCSVFGQKSYNGVAVLTKSPHMVTGKGLLDNDKDARLLSVKVDNLEVVNCYVPQGRSPDHEYFQYKNQWLRNLRDVFLAKRNPDQDILVLGDMNVAPEAIDTYDSKAMFGKIGFHPEERASLKYLMDWGLTDIFRFLKPEASEFSWWDYRAGSFQKNKGLRIDLLLGTRSVLSSSRSAGIDRDARKILNDLKPSDHVPVWLEVEY